MKLRPGLAPQCPSRRSLMCSGFSGFAKQRIVAQVDHARGEVVAGAPVGVDLAQFVGRKPVRNTWDDTARFSCVHISERCFH